MAVWENFGLFGVASEAWCGIWCGEYSPGVTWPSLCRSYWPATPSSAAIGVSELLSGCTGKHQEVPSLPLCARIVKHARAGVRRQQISRAATREVEIAEQSYNATDHCVQRTRCEAAMIFVRGDTPLHHRTLPRHDNTSPYSCKTIWEAHWTGVIRQWWWHFTTTP